MEKEDRRVQEDVETPGSWSELDVALCHDWLTGMRGGERVLELLCRRFPSASIHTLLHNRDAVSRTINQHAIHTSWLQHVPGIMRHYRLFLPVLPAAVDALRIPEKDLLISTSHCVAKSARPKGRTRHLCYCFTPMRYAWTFYREYFGSNPVKALLLRPLLAALKAWDRRTAQRVDRFVAISRHVRQRLRDYYGRDADVVYPPVDLRAWTPSEQQRGDFDLIVSALVPYKRIDLAVQTYTRLGRRLTVVGVGGERTRLEAMAGPSVSFLGWQEDDAVLDLYRRCRMLVFPGEEDFGLVPLEAQACGCPVLAYGRGGVLETVVEGKTGLFFDAQSEGSLTEGLKRSETSSWDTRVIRAHAEGFGIDQFYHGMDESIRACLAG